MLDFKYRKVKKSPKAPKYYTSYIRIQKCLFARLNKVMLQPESPFTCGDSQPGDHCYGTNTPKAAWFVGRGLSPWLASVKNVIIFFHPPRNNEPVVLLYTCWGHPTHVGTSNALVFGFMTSPVGSHSSVTFTDEVTVTSERLPLPALRKRNI